MIWGYGCPWYGTFMTLDEEPLWAKLKFLLQHDLKLTGIGMDEVVAMSGADRDRLGRFLADNDLRLIPRIWYDYLHADDDEAGRRTDEIVAAVGRYVPLLRATAVMTMAGKPGHRFHGPTPLPEKLARLAARLAPLAAACKEAGAPLGINNQGDYYCCDFVEICRQAPGLGIYLDTANVFWVGEQAMPAYEAAAPYVVGTHWRDEIVNPGQTKPQRVELLPCPTGRGNVPLRECYDLLLRSAPNPEAMPMEIEMIRPRGTDDMECLRESLAFVRSLGGGES